MSDPAILRFRALVEAGLVGLEARRQEVNNLNVFPVADGDTGDNMVLTLRAVLDELDQLLESSEHHTIDEIGREQIVESVARAALLGARGNSGVILSQLIRGAAEELVSRPGELVDPVLIGAALARAADQAYGSVREPAEGTILTVAREMATRAASEIAHMPQARLRPGATHEQQDAAAAEIIERALQAGQESVARGPDLLPVLREAGVVDAGGYGLTVLLAGMVGSLRGGEPVQIERHAAARITHPQHVSATFRYCTNFAVTGTQLDQRAAVEALERLGDSVLVVGDTSTLKVHVHTDDPDAAVACFGGRGATVSRIDIADMNVQVRQRDARLLKRRCAGLAVVTGDGFRELFEGLGVSVIEGGPTLNPSTYDLLAAIHAVGSEEVVVLPNNKNVFMAAERAAQLADQDVHVVYSSSLQAGLAAAVAFKPDHGADVNAAEMARVADAVRTGAVAQAARDDAQGRFSAGEAVGFLDGEIVAWGSPQATLAAVIKQLGAGAELVSALRGVHAPLDDESVRALAGHEVDLEIGYGGQAGYWWLLSAE
ncbi:MAG: DAK2 domain-containing protein [Solirubrobacteraceae bacterium]